MAYIIEVKTASIGDPRQVNAQDVWEPFDAPSFGSRETAEEFARYEGLTDYRIRKVRKPSEASCAASTRARVGTLICTDS